MSEKTLATAIRSKKSDKRAIADVSTARRDFIPAEKSVDKYAKNKNIHEIEVEFNYGTDEDSVYASHEYELYRMPPEITHKFVLGSDSSFGARKVQDMLRRFKKDTQSYEFIVKFNCTVEKTDESTISMAGNTAADIVDMKERRRYMRKEMRAHV